MADYLATQDDLFRRFHAARTTTERDQIVTDLERHADRRRDLIDQMARYQTAHGNKGADARRQDQDDEPEADPAPRRRTTPTKTAKTTATGRKTTSSSRTRPTS